MKLFFENPGKISSLRRAVLCFAAFIIVFQPAFIERVMAATQASERFTVSLSTTGSDTLPPTIPGNLLATAVSSSQIDLTWDASADLPDGGQPPSGLAGYRIFRDSVFLATTTLTSYSDSSLSASTAYEYFVQAFDNSLNISDSSNRATATTLAAPLPPTVLPGGGGGMGSTRLQIINFQILPGESRADVSFTTNLPSQAKVYWGKTSEFEAGTISSLFYGISHDLTLTGLESGTNYMIRMEATDARGFSVYQDASFMTSFAWGMKPLPNPSNFLAKAEDKQISLTWTNTEDPRLSKVRIVRGANFFPKDPFDGQPIYEGTGEQAYDTDVEIGKTYYYAIFSEGTDGSFSSGALAQARIQRPGEEPIAVDPFSGIPQSESADPKIKALTLSDFDFIQDGHLLTQVNGQTVAINGSQDLTIRLSYEKVPEVLKTVAFTLSDPHDPTKVFPFLLRINSEKTAYEATIGALGKSGNYLLNVVVLDYQNQGLKRIQGNLRAAAFEAFGDNKNFDPLAFVFLFILFIVALLVTALRRRDRKVDYGQAFRNASRSSVSLLIVIAMTVPLLAISAYSQKAGAAFNPEINYQGKLTNSSNVIVPNGSYNIRFNLYTAASGGSPIWTETWCESPDNGATCNGTGTDNRVTLTNGLFSVMLGSTTALTGVDFNQALYLGVQIGGSGATPSWDSEMSPRKRLGAVPAAFVAEFAQNASSSDTLSGLSASQFLRSDAENATTSASTFLSIVQNGAGKVAEFFGPVGQSILSILSNGNVGIGSTTPGATLGVNGDVMATGFIGTSLASEGNPCLSIKTDGRVATTTCIGGAAGNDTEIQFNNAGNFGSSPDLAWVAGDLVVGGVSKSATIYSSAINTDYITDSDSDGGINFGFSHSYGKDGASLIDNSGDPALDFENHYFLDTGDNPVAWWKTSGATANFRVFGDTIVDTKLGIGTTTPTNALEVAGSSFLGGNVTATGTLSVYGDTYLANASTTNLTVSSNLYLGSLNGFLQALNGVVSASSTLSIAYGGTGLSTAPTYGQLLLGNSSGGYSLTSTSSLGLLSASQIQSGTQGQIAFYNANGTTISATSSLFIAQNGNIGISTTSPISRFSVVGDSYFAGGISATGTITTYGSSLTDTAQISSTELADSTGWTTTNWTGDFNSGFTHSAGNTSALSRTMTVSGTYQISFTISGRTAGSVRVSLGYATTTQSFYANQTHVTAPKTAIDNGPLVFTPTSDFDGTISLISVKKVLTISSPIFVLKDSLGTVGTEIRQSLASLANTFVGYRSGGSDTVGQSNSAFGSNALYANTSGDNNSAFGSAALYTNSIGLNNSAFGAFSLYTNTTGSDNTAQGYNALRANTTGTGNSAIGVYSLYTNSSGQYNSALGYSSLQNNTTGSYNTAQGASALGSNISGTNNVALGSNSLFKNTTGSGNLAIGYNALYNNTTGTGNAVGGYEALGYNISATSSTAFGYQAGRGASNTSNQNNSLFGYQSGYALSSGSNNLLLGYKAGDALNTGSNNILLGYDVDATSTDSVNFLNIGNTIYGNLGTRFVGIGTTTPWRNLSVEGTSDLGWNALAGSFTATSSTASVFPYASTTALTVSGANGLTLGTLNGPLQAVNGAVSATSTLSTAYGGTGLSTSPTYGQILVGNASGGYTLTSTSSLGISAGSATGQVIVSHADGSETVYNTTTDTDIARGNLLLEAASFTYPNDVINLSADTFDIGTRAIDLATSTGSFSIEGKGKYLTTIKSSSLTSTNGIIIKAAASSTVSHLTIQQTNGTEEGPVWGTVATGDLGDASLNDVRIIGFTHGVYIANSGVFSGELDNVTIESQADGVYMSPVSGTLTINDSSISAESAAGSYMRGVAILGGVVDLYDTDIAVSGGDTYNYGIYVFSMSDALGANIDGGSITTSGEGAYDFYNESFASEFIKVTSNTSYDISKTSGTITTSDSNRIVKSISNSTLNFGIGTTSPFAKLSVAGDSYIGGNLTATGTLTVTGTATSTIAGGFTVGTTNLLVQAATGRVGIGTTSPFAKLSVAGDSYIGGNLTATGTLSVLGTATSTMAGGFTIGTTNLLVQGATGRVGLGTASPTAVLHLKAGSATANTAPLKFTSGTLLGTAEVGAMEFDGSKYYGTITGPARKEFTLNDSSLVSGSVPFTTSTGRLSSSASMTWNSTDKALVLAGQETNSSLRVGPLEFQGYGINNNWFGDNIYYNNSLGGFIRRNDGSAGMFYFQGTEGQFRFFPSGDAGTVAGNSGNYVQLKILSSGTVALGNNFSTASNDVSEAMLVASPDGVDMAVGMGKVGIGTDVPEVKLQVDGGVLLNASTSEGGVTIRNGTLDLGDLFKVQRNDGAALFAISDDIESLYTPNGSVYIGQNDISATTFTGEGSGLYNIPSSGLIWDGNADLGTNNLYAANIGIGTTTTAANKLEVGGNATIAGNITVTNVTATGTLAVSGLSTMGNASTTQLSVSNALYNSYLTSYRVPYTATSGLLTDSSKLTFNETTFTVGGIIKANNGANDIILQDGAGNNAFRSVRGATWADGVNTQYFQVGNSSDSRMMFTAQNAGTLTRLGMQTSGLQIFSGTRSSLPAPGGPLEVRNGSNVLLFNVLAAGNVGIGTSTPFATLSIAGSSYVGGNLSATGTVTFTGLANSEVGYHVCLSSTNTLSYSATACDGSSSLTVKHDIQDVGSSLSKVLQMRPVSFVYNQDVSPGDQTVHLGFIAEEVNNIEKNLVTYNPDGTPKSVKYPEFIPLVVKSIQEQQKQIGDLASSTNSISGTNVALQNKDSELGISITEVKSDISDLQSRISALSSTTSTQNQTAVTVESISLSLDKVNERIDTISSRIDGLASTSEIASNIENQLGSSETFIGKIASSTASLIAGTESFINAIASAVTEKIKAAGEFAVNKISAHVAYVNRVEAETAAISKGLEMTDQNTGQIYCVSIANGDWSKRLGTCTTASSSPVLTSWTDNPVSSNSTAIITQVPVAPIQVVASSTTETNYSTSTQTAASSSIPQSSPVSNSGSEAPVVQNIETSSLSTDSNAQNGTNQAETTNATSVSSETTPVSTATDISVSSIIVPAPESVSADSAPAAQEAAPAPVSTDTPAVPATE